ncbi:Hypothetical predicted protein [Pelobates cultripes]|uniref:Uncharacterized protein n=1 Tax=Pelobates cultripes TaxID=61616 RepID=A0AAD1VRI4_PELCU|nr:Hypothetical predicted protein [Pelobates cultripes]
MPVQTKPESAVTCCDHTQSPRSGPTQEQRSANVQACSNIQPSAETLLQHSSLTCRTSQTDAWWRIKKTLQKDPTAAQATLHDTANQPECQRNHVKISCQKETTKLGNQSLHITRFTKHAL